jgi:hypothetical protein
MNAQVPCADGIDQATVNVMYRSLDSDGAPALPPGRSHRRMPGVQRPARPAGPSGPAAAAATSKAAAGASRPRFSDRRPEGAARSAAPWPGGKRLGLDGDGTRNASAATDGNSGGGQGPELLVSVTGPPSSLGGPGYDEGIFWAEVLIELGGADAAAPAAADSLNNSDTAADNNVHTVWYTVDGSSPNCSGGAGAAVMYTGPALVARMGGSPGAAGVVSAVACRDGAVVAAGRSAPAVLVDGPHVSIMVAVTAAGEGGEVGPLDGLEAQLPGALCDALGIGAFCLDRIAVDPPDAAAAAATGGLVVVHVLAATNAEAGEWRRVMVLNATILQYFVASSANVTVTDVEVTVPVPLHKRHHSWQFCTSHYDCAVVDPRRIGTDISSTLPQDLPWGAGFCAAYGSRLSDGRAPTCDYCQVYCMIESIDSFDGVCPEHCGNYFSGQVPACISAEKLRRTYSCEDRHRFELRQYTQEEETVADPREAKMNALRSLTPSNHLIGGVILTQYRVPVGSCPASSTAGMRRFNDVHAVQCAHTAAVDRRPFGVDPAFAASSTLFDGKHTPGDFYNLSGEVFTTGQAGTPTVTPYGFFPHQWDCATGAMKNASRIWGPSVDEFKLYFDGRITHDQAQKLLQYMEDGRFFDVSTSRLKVEMITYNAEVRLFAIWTVVFDWHRTGDISWDYALQVVNVDDSETPLRSWVAGLALFMLAFHLGLEVRQIYVHCRAMRLGEYCASFFNHVDWLNFAIQAVAWMYWYEIRSEIAAFEMDESSYVLADPQARFRPFTTDAEQEHKLLALIDQVSTLGDLQGYQASFAGISIILFVLKMIASLDFQPKMGLITRTLSRAGSNLTHYLALYFLVFMGYAMVGNLMFGSLYAGMATLSDTCQTLMFFMLAFDPTQFYSQMNHAITHREGSSIQPGTMEYNIYLWTFMFINAFILMNIFLAIIVSAYDDVARQSDGSSGMLTDLREMAGYYTKRLLLPSTHFLSDDELLLQIQRELQRIAGKSWGETEFDARAHTVRDALAPMRAIMVGRGVALEREQIKGLVERAIQGKAQAAAAGGGGLAAALERVRERLVAWAWPSPHYGDSDDRAVAMLGAGLKSTRPSLPVAATPRDEVAAAAAGGGCALERRRSLSMSHSQVSLLLIGKCATEAT